MGDVTYAPRQPGNYIQEYNDQFRRGPQKYPDMDRDALAELAVYGQLMAESSCWVLSEPVRDFIMNTTIPSDALEDWKLPYPSMAIEWLGTWDVDAVNKNRRDNETYVPALERIIKLSDTGSMYMEEVDGDKRQKHPTIPGFVVTSFFKQPTFEEAAYANLTPMPWVINPVAVIIPYHALNHLDNWFGKDKNGDLKFDSDVYEPGHVPTNKPAITFSVPASFNAWPAMVKNGTVHQGLRDMVEEVHIALGLLAMLRCDNVPTKVIQASPLKQRRRKQQKKTRIPDYRVLHISDHTLRGYAGGKGQHGEKAPHWRRGHIRMQPTAMGPIRKWIAPQIIRADKLNGDMPLPRTAVT